MPEHRCEIVEVVIFSLEEGLAEYLLLKRAPSVILYPGIWQFVSGGIVEGERGYDAAYREYREETGIECRRFYTVPHMNLFYDPAHDLVHHTVVFAAEVEPNSEPILSDEHSEYRWCDFELGRELLVWPGQRQALEIVHNYIVSGHPAGRLQEITHLIT